MVTTINKCSWALSSLLEEHYHDHEWGQPVRDDRLLFEFLILEGAQAGLSWLTILKKRPAYRELFADFDAATVARYDESTIQALISNPAIIRNKLKIRAAVSNAQAYLQVQQAFGSFSDYLWAFVDNQPIQNHWRCHAELPASTSISEALSRDLHARGFKFVGPTICYAFMQAIGMVNDHTVDCFRHIQLSGNQ